MERIYETERLILKVLTENDANLVTDYIIRNKEFFRSFEPEREKEFYTENHQTRVLRNDLNYMESRSMLKLWIFDKVNPNNIIGQVVFYNIVPFAFLSCHLGYRSDINEQCKGKITEAVKKGIQIMFEEYGMHRIEAYTLPHNKASQRVLEKLGFINEGIAHKFLEVNGIWEDHHRFALINEC